MKKWPSLQDYNRALAPGNLTRNLRLAGFEDAHILTNAYGSPAAISGGFAYIYQLILRDGTKKALRLFHSAPEARIPSMEAAYRLAARIATSQEPLAEAFINTHWINNGFFVQDLSVPAIIMDWIDDPILASWLEKQYRNRSKIRTLRQKLFQLQALLEAAQVVHGDIQANNIAITKQGDPILLDYDSLGERNSYDSRWEKGHIHFQHPDGNRQVNGIDRFPFLVIDLGLALLEEAPELFETYSQGENILFTADDFYSPRTSQILSRGASLPHVTEACRLFMEICSGPSNTVPTLAEFHQKAGIRLEELPQAATATDYTHEIQSSSQAVPKKAHIGAGSETAETAEKRESKHYRPVYPVYSAERFLSLVQENGLYNPMPKLESLPIIGQKIELVGKIYEIKKGRTKYDDPYVFVNFNDWRMGGIKLIFWAEGLDAFEDHMPEESWKGRWVSATGMVDEPYQGRMSFPQFSITMYDPSQIRFISSEEARRRLASAKPIPVPAASTVHESPARYDANITKQKQSSKIAAVSVAEPPAGTAPVAETKLPSNADLLRQLEREMHPPAHLQGRTPQGTHPRGSTPANKNQSETSGCILYILVMLGILIWMIVSRP